MAYPIAPLGGPSYVPPADNRQLNVGDVIKFNENWKYPNEHAKYGDDENKTVIRGRYQVWAIFGNGNIALDELDATDKGRSFGDVVVPAKYLKDAPYYKLPK